MSNGVLLVVFVANGIYTWIRVLKVIPYSSNCMTTLVQISQQSAMVRPFFLGVLVFGVVAFELFRHQLPKGWRFAYPVLLGFGAALLVAPWLVDLFYS